MGNENEKGALHDALVKVLGVQKCTYVVTVLAINTSKALPI
jgi:hypothetical protein